MRHLRLPFAAALLPILVVTGALAQSPGAQEPGAATPAPTAPTGEAPQAATPTSPVTTVAPALSAKDLEGLDVVDSEGNQIGKVTKVNEADGKVTSVEVKSPGMFGFFAKTYVVSVEKLNKKDGRVVLSMTSEEAKQLVK